MTTPPAAAAATLAPPELAELAAQLSGPLLTPESAEYDAERSGFQLARQHRPAVIIGAARPEDVQAAVRFASRHGLPVAVQATGHASAAVAGDGGLLITTSRMRGVAVDAHARTARLAAGTRWDEVIAEAAPTGLAPLSGSLPTVGAVSYTLGGGLGPLSRRYGYAADHVRSLDVVTADGERHQVTAESSPDLFWALRGARDNVGIVVAMEIDLVPVRTLYGGAMYFTGPAAAAAVDLFAEWTRGVPDGMTSSIAVVSVPDLPMVPEPIRGRRVTHLRVAYTADDLTGGPALVAPFRELGPVIDTVGEMPVTAIASIHNDPTTPAAAESDTTFLRALSGDAVRTLLTEAGPEAASPTLVEVRHLGGRLSHPADVPNAVGHRDAGYLLNVISPLRGVTAEEARARHREVLAAMAPWSTGGRGLNFIGADGARDVRSAYEPDDYARLARVKAAYDPHNLFRHNLNVPPAPDPSEQP
ncbi:FAD-binding oxidoreductase [Georgenia faecalis]|uniref:FAD-binding oxidoreductase n=1 Tax=Georgenia faecalis TaxID=2483799 RepID=A0ABV9DB65_9MICO|nr:FAD-binding oxidoreductase [Georgenia faecalis]